MKIPVIPISYLDAQPFLQKLSGAVVPPKWRGALPITYHFGPGPARVHLSIQSNWSTVPVYDVIATIPGAVSPDQWVIRGNHHDGWTFGASDPLAGNVSLMEEAKAIGGLLKTGWRPKRTLVYASWDAEEPGLLGSTEWVEAHAQELRNKAVVYVNSDVNVRGFLGAAGSHSLQHLVNEVAAGITDPETHVTVQQRLRAKMEVEGFDNPQQEELQSDARLAAAGGDLPIAALGSGSDYSAFLQHLGIATINLEYGGEAETDGIYHSDYDTFDYYVRFGDPDFLYGLAEAKTIGHFVLRMADATLIPLEFGEFADTVGGYVRELHELVSHERTQSSHLAQLQDEKAFNLAADPIHVVAAPERKSVVPYVNLTPLDDATLRLKTSAAAYGAAASRLASDASGISADKLTAVNKLLQSCEGQLTDARGLPGRDWFKHMIYAPGSYTGYAPKTLPGVREAIEQQRWDEANRYAQITADAIERYATMIDRATQALQVN